MSRDVTCGVLLCDSVGEVAEVPPPQRSPRSLPPGWSQLMLTPSFGPVRNLILCKRHRKAVEQALTA